MQPIPDTITAPVELKFLDGEPDGTFGGLGSVFGNQDGHGDVIIPGAFAASIAEHKAAGTMPGMYAEHSYFVGGDPLPIGVWDQMSEEDGGLRVKGRLIGMEYHPEIRRTADLMRANALKGLSIAFRPTSYKMGKKPGEPRRTLSSVKLAAIDVVANPSNPMARIDSMKSANSGDTIDLKTATEALARAMQRSRDAIAGSATLKNAEMIALLEELAAAQMDVHMALTGEPLPREMRSEPTIRELENGIRQMFGFSNARAREVTERGFKSSPTPRDEGSDQVTAAEMKAASDEVASALNGFSLPSF